MDYGKILGWSLVALSLSASIGYAITGDWRRSAYFLFAACINVTVIV